jgi:hypothetical protein
MTLSELTRTPLVCLRKPPKYDSRGRPRSTLMTVLDINAAIFFVRPAAGVISR